MISTIENDNDSQTDALTSESNKNFLRYFNKALIFQSNNQYEQAIVYYEKAAVLQPTHLPTYQVLGYLYQSLGKWQQALTNYQAAIKLHNASSNLHNSAGICEENCNNLPAAKDFFLESMKLKENNPEALNNLGGIYRKLGEYKSAERYLLRSLRLKISVEVLANLGVLMSEIGNVDQAISFYDHALRLQPNNTKIQWNKALALLSGGNFTNGWQLYDQGVLAKTRKKQLTPQVSSDEDYNIRYFENKTVYIRGEQGVGDEIMFASCFSDVISVAKKCIIECDERLTPLFERSFPEATVVTEYDGIAGQANINAIAAEIHISAASIPRFTRHSFQDFDNASSFLQSEPSAVKFWKSRYQEKQKKLNVGISWKGGLKSEARRRSTTLSEWGDLLNRKDINFVNLQYGDYSSEETLANSLLSEWPETCHTYNLEQLAAQISALDLVITVSNATAHLAAALGVPVFILLPLSPNWRWFRGTNPSPWYPSAKLFKQNMVDDWSDVFTQIESELNTFMHTAYSQSEQENETPEVS